jgi:hypothetical protein
VSEKIDVKAQCWAMARRVGAKIAASPIGARERALDGTESCLRAAGCELGAAGERLDRIVDLQMWAIRKIVADIDTNGTPASTDVVAANTDASPTHPDIISAR